MSSCIEVERWLVLHLLTNLTPPLAGSGGGMPMKCFCLPCLQASFTV